MLRLLLLILFTTSCASYQNDLAESRSLLSSQRAQEAANKIKSHASKESKDQLAYMLDYATALFEAGQFKESSQAFMAADKLVDFNDYLSLSKLGASLLLNEGMVQYKGDSFEKIMINVYLALCFLQLGDVNEAAVEARRLNQRLMQLSENGEKDFNRSFFARYLSAMIWEEIDNFDSAYLDYKFAYKISNDTADIKKYLSRAAVRAQRADDLKLLGIHESIKPIPKGDGELIVISLLGWVPRKGPSYQDHRFPQLYPVPSRGKAVAVSDDKELKGYTSEIFNVGQVAQSYFNDMIGPLIAKRIAALAVKAVAAKQIGDKNAGLGALAWLALNVADRADDRQWSFLPEQIQIFRMVQKPGTYSYNLQAVDSDKVAFGEIKKVEYQIRPHKKTFVIQRFF